ncbi:MAG: O-antigen ligase family protein [Brumimicrobium sp.]|nr:O-antigen ligase family protein [Brumimicrobium sp.]
MLNKLNIPGPLSIYLFAFMIALNPKWYGFILIAVVVESLIRYKSITDRRVNGLFSVKSPILWLSLFFIIHLIGLWNSENKEFAYMDIGMKSAFLVFPVYFLAFKPKIDNTQIFRAFSLGALFSLGLYFFVGFIYYLNDFETSHFTGPEFSFWMHRGYYATYLVIGGSYFLYKFISSSKHRIYNLLIASILFGGVILTQSKTGILLLLANVFILVFYFLKNALGAFKASMSVLIIITGVILFFVFLVPKNNRFSGAIYFFQHEKPDVRSVESTTARRFMWETSADLIGDHFFAGVGTGDIKDELQKLNYEKGYVGVADKKLNAHNQFLNSWVALGLLGFLTLLAIFLSSIPLSGVKNRLFIILIIWTFFFSFLTESFLEVQAGIIPFAFFICVIGLIKLRRKQNPLKVFDV